MPLLIGNIPLRKCFKNLETETDYHTESQFTIPFKIHKHKGLRKYQLAYLKMYYLTVYTIHYIDSSVTIHII